MEETTPKNLREILTETMDLRSLDIERLSQLSGVPGRYLVAIRDNDFSKLPPAPYVRGYLMKISEILNIDGYMLWEIYQNQNPLKKSGIGDKLPINRFAIKSWDKKLVTLGIFLVLVIIYLVWLGSDFLGNPSIEITSPAVNNFVATSTSYIKLTGRVDSQDKLTINEEEVLVKEGGRFEKEFPLQPGINAIEFKVKKILGKEIKVVRNVIYQPQAGN